jgi:hypothetical protein
MLESRNHVKHPKLGNPVLIYMWQQSGELKLLEAMETRDKRVVMYIVKFI